MRAWSMGVFASLLAVTALDNAAASRRSAVAPVPFGMSIGSPNGGRLDGGSRLEVGRYVRVVPFYAGSQARWGLPSLVALIDRAARRVAQRYPDAVLAVGDLSRRGGGELDRHRSHESGRDVDVAFFARTASNKPLIAERFVAFGPTGAARTVPGAVFDDVRNWALVEALVEDAASPVSHIFVSSPLRARLLRYAEQHGARLAVRERAALLMMQPRHALPHDDHFHVRIACPAAQLGTCVEDAVLPVSRARPMLASLRRRGGTPVAPAPLPRWRGPEALASSSAYASERAADEAEDIVPPATSRGAGDPRITQPLARRSTHVDGVTQVSDRAVRGTLSERLRPLANAPPADNVDR